MRHRQTREGDEYACTCGLRWDVKEEDPHRLRADKATELRGDRPELSRLEPGHRLGYRPGR